MLYAEGSFAINKRGESRARGGIGLYVGGCFYGCMAKINLYASVYQCIYN